MHEDLKYSNTRFPEEETIIPPVQQFQLMIDDTRECASYLNFY